MAASECLVGCMLQGISPFDEDNEVVWDDREACDSTTIGCEVYEEPLVGQFECDDNDFNDLSSSSSLEECSWAGVVRQAVEMFPAISTGISPFDEDNEVVWDDREACDSTTIGCEGISPFDEDNEVVWDDREACDSTTIGCEGISPFDEDNEVVWDDREACDSTTIGCELGGRCSPGG
ncbi:hypothetical protein Esi_0075_0025 [Ectocarpus siliculosus]|uniref:Uncharacterized protein n=1 Tax=Ectocarpus siliculosus TaxID=2880 RepID=D7G6H9_ECTSI|nr:hypothetical protein Esi_0075_0025 [Ectocarpus siliculosus]|eukprot:CBJ27564.1 hypothetical protein Esi_0075_0025 [Ectocarpus siliculosus]